MNGVRNSKLSVDFDLSHGITLSNITDVATGRTYLSVPSMLFEFAINNGTPVQSNLLIVPPGGISNSPDATSMTVTASTEGITLYFEATLALDASVAIFTLSVMNLGSDAVFFRLVLPKIRGISIAAGNPGDMIGAVPQEAGSVTPLSSGTILGMEFNLDVGLPYARNNMEVASIFDQAQGGGVFFCDLDGDANSGVSPLQFNLSAQEVVAFWTGWIAPDSTAQVPRLGIGVHSTGDWHQAVDYYTSVHRPRWSFPTTPAWFRNAGAIYCPTSFGAGGIYLNFFPRSLAKGAVSITWEANDGPWRDGVMPDPNDPGSAHKVPLAVSPAGFAPPEAFLLAAAQNANQIGIFAVGDDGGVWTTWELGDGPWTNNRNGLTPARITPPGLTLSGGPLASGQQGADQFDIFFVDKQGAINVTWERGDGIWTDGQDGRPGPARITATGFAPEGAYLATARQSDTQLDLFVIGNDGNIWVLWLEGYGAWSQAPITSEQLFPPGAPLIAAWQNPTQLNVFAVSRASTILSVFQQNGGGWSPAPVAVSPQGFVPPGAHLAWAKQSATQLDVFVVRPDAAIWVIWEKDDGAWTDGNDGRLPVPISGTDLAPSGAPLAAVSQGSDQCDVFVVGYDGAIWVTWEKGDGAWTDSPLGQPDSAQRVTPPTLFYPASGVAAITQETSQINAFAVGFGSLRSFLDLSNILTNEAMSLGTNILYLTDYWEGTDQGSDPPYFNKGDYQPRLDLGGESALIQGIAAVHQAGGRIILYVEPFIIYKYSAIGQQKGDAWAGRNGKGTEDATYPDCYTMVAPYPGWQDYIVSVTERLVNYGADGIFLDSYGWQMNRPLQCNGDPLGSYEYTAQEYASGVLDLTEKVRKAIQKINPEAVVMGETTAGPIAQRWDGGLDADFGFGGKWANKLETLIASPVRYGIPEVHIFTNGNDLNGLHQMYAAGHGLALCNFWPGDFISKSRDHIKALVDIRTTYKDALIAGQQISQPMSSNPQVVAYQYRGVDHTILTIVTIGSQNTIANIDLNPYDPGGCWQDLLTSDTLVSSGGVLQDVALSKDVGGIRVLLKV